MKAIAMGIVVGLLLAAGAARAEGELNIYNWRGYTSPKVIEKFMHTYGVVVTVDEYDSNDELISTLRASNASYDIAVPTSGALQQLIEENLLAETKPYRMANFKNVDPRWIETPWDPGRNYSVHFCWGLPAWLSTLPPIQATSTP